MAVTASDLRTRFPKTFGSTSEFSDTVLDLAIAEASACVGMEQAGTDFDTLVLYLAAHKALIDTKSDDSEIDSRTAIVGSVTFGRTKEEQAQEFLNEYNGLARKRQGIMVLC
jgi:hypothetical protein